MLGLEIYPDILSKLECEHIIAHFERDDRTSVGVSYNNEVDTSIKSSTDLVCDFNDTQYSQYNSIILPKLSIAIDKFIQQYQFLQYIDEWELTATYNIQRYDDGQGFYQPHCEHSAFFYRRILAWMIYLNDSPCGTEFPYQKIKLQASQGNGAIWSASWTHPHKGVTPNIGTKYIVTGWCQFKHDYGNTQ